MENKKNELKLQDFGRSDNYEFISDLFNRGFLHILEKIILEFPLRTILACKAVSPEWSSIVSYFHTAKNSRIQKKLDFRMNEEWKNKSPTIISKPFSDLLRQHSVDHIGCCGFIADERHVIMNARLLPGRLNYSILVFDAETLSLVKNISKFHQDLPPFS